jgi:hypothetical protein
MFFLANSSKDIVNTESKLSHKTSLRIPKVMFNTINKLPTIVTLRRMTDLVHLSREGKRTSTSTPATCCPSSIKHGTALRTASPADNEAT